MTVIRLDYLPFVIVAFLVFCLFYLKQNRSFYKWVRAHWFYRQSLLSRLATFIYLIAIALLLISLLDFRGKEHKIKSNIPDQKTIILIDSSSSMLVEDVRPNRFQKALLLTRHYIKQAAGQQISVILFSDYQKTYVPFTTDIDLLDARISGLSTLNISKGGSNLSQAIQESIQYFKENSGDSKVFAGNILIFTDAEETVEGFDLQVPDGISIGVVGVGTARGGPIPLRDTRNVSYGTKQHNGQEVISKLDETFLKVLATKVKIYKYWIATSFALPTEEIVKFFTQVHNKRFSQGDVKVRPVKAELVLIPALLLFSLAMIFKMQKSFVMMLMFCLLSFSNQTFAQGEDDEAAPPPLDDNQKSLVAKIARGEASKEEKLILAESFLKTKKIDSAITLFEENLKGSPTPEHFKSYMNFGTALIKSEQMEEGLKVYSSLIEKLKQNPTSDNQQLLKVVRANTLLAFKKDEENKQNKKDKKQQNKDQQNQDQKDQEQKEQKDEMDKKDNDAKRGSGKNSQSDKKDEKSGKDKEKDQKDGKGEKEKEKEKNKDKKKDGEGEGEDEQDKKDKGNQESGEDKENENQEKEKNGPEKRLKVKLPAQLKQLMSDDRALQEKILDTSTNETGKSKKAKDW